MINLQLHSLFAAFRRIKEAAPDDLITALRELPEPGVLPSPWSVWTLIGLIRHLKRQQWVAEIIRTRLQGSPETLSRLGTLGAPNGVPRSGPVPGSPEWEYSFHGIGCRLKHKVEGQSIEVEFFDSTADYFRTCFYIKYLQSLRRPEPPEQRLCELHPSFRAISITVKALLEAGALTLLPGKFLPPYRLSDEVMEFADDIDLFCDAWSNADCQVWLAALIGDWLAADAAAAGRPDLSAITAPRARRCREIRQRRLSGELADSSLGASALWALADLRPPNLDQYLEDALRNSSRDMVSTSLDIILQYDSSHLCQRVYELFSSVDSSDRPEQSGLWIQALEFLLLHSYPTADVKASLARATGMAVGEAVLLSLEYAPELALPLIRRGLFSEVWNRFQIIATLTLIDAPWSKRELLAVLEASDEKESTAEVRAALMEFGDEATQRAVLDWEESNPHESEFGLSFEINGCRMGPFYNMTETSFLNTIWPIKHMMNDLNDRVHAVRKVIPPDPPTV